MVLPRAAKVYITFTALTAVSLGAYCIWRYPLPADLSTWLVMLGLALLIGLSYRRSLMLLSGQHISVDTILAFAAILLLNPLQVMLTLSVGTVIGWVGQKPAPAEWIFNFAQNVVSLGLSALLLNTFITPPWRPVDLTAWLALLAAGVVMFTFNYGLVCGVVCAQRHLNFWRVWRDGLRASQFVDLVMYGFGLLTALVVAIYPWALILAALPAIAVFIAMERTLRLEAEQHKLVETLEQRVADRTRVLSEANVRLQDLDRLKDQFISNVSHDLRTPLTSIKLYLGLLETGKSERRAYYFEALRREADRLQTLIEDLLDLSRLDQGALAVDLQPIDLAATLRPLIDDRLPLARERGLTLDYRWARDLPPIRSDATLIAQVASNLIANAINYTPDGGSICVDARLDHDGVVFSVSDSGPGISDRDLPYLFERFYRGEAARQSQVSGTGLGLAICKEIVERLNGRLTVESQIGQGATFAVWLPCAETP